MYLTACPFRLLLLDYAFEVVCWMSAQYFEDYSRRVSLLPSHPQPSSPCVSLVNYHLDSLSVHFPNPQISGQARISERFNNYSFTEPSRD